MLMNPEQRAVLSEIIAISAGKATERLRDIATRETHLTKPTVSVMTPNQANDEIATGAAGWGCSVKIEFKGAISGTASVLFNTDEASNLATEFATAYDLPECDEADTLTEFANILLNIYLGSLSNALGTNLTYQPPVFDKNLQAGLYLPEGARGDETVILGISTSLLLESQALQASLVVLLGVPSIVLLSAVADRCAVAGTVRS